MEGDKDGARSRGVFSSDPRAQSREKVTRATHLTSFYTRARRRARRPYYAEGALAWGGGGVGVQRAL